MRLPCAAILYHDFLTLVFVGSFFNDPSHAVHGSPPAEYMVYMGDSLSELTLRIATKHTRLTRAREELATTSHLLEMSSLGRDLRFSALTEVAGRKQCSGFSRVQVPNQSTTPSKMLRL